jgi:hypothetical protein
MQERPKVINEMEWHIPETEPGFPTVLVAGCCKFTLQKELNSIEPELACEEDTSTSPMQELIA